MSYDSFFKQAKEAKSPKSYSEEQIESELRKAFGMKTESSSKKKFVIKNASGKDSSSKSASDKNSSNKKSSSNSASKTKKKSSFPIYPMFSLVAMAAGLLSYMLVPEFFNAHLSRVEIGFMGEASANSDGKNSTPSKVETAEKSAAGKAVDVNPETAKHEAPVTEDPSYFSKLRERKEQLDLREAELNQLEEELQRQKAEIEQRITELSQVRNDIAKTLEDRVQADEGKVKKLVELYSSMKPKQAADVISSIDSDLAVEVLASMKKKSAADIMNVLSSEKAKELSEKLTGYRRGTASEH